VAQRRASTERLGSFSESIFGSHDYHGARIEATIRTSHVWCTSAALPDCIELSLQSGWRQQLGCYRNGATAMCDVKSAAHGFLMASTEADCRHLNVRRILRCIHYQNF
jgi:hypothetical protein